MTMAGRAAKKKGVIFALHRLALSNVGRVPHPGDKTGDKTVLSFCCWDKIVLSWQYLFTVNSQFCDC